MLFPVSCFISVDSEIATPLSTMIVETESGAFMKEKILHRGGLVGFDDGNCPGRSDDATTRTTHTK